MPEDIDERAGGPADLTPADDDPARPHRQRRLLLLVPLLGLMAAAALAVAVYLRSDEVGIPNDQVMYVVPTAPHLSASGSDQTVYRIDAAQSSVAYDVEEQLVGSSHTAHATTKGVAGDLLVDRADPSRSQLGDVVVNVEQLTSDQELRDRRIRADYLQSSRYPLAVFHTERLAGLPAAIADGTPYAVQAEGTLTVREVAHPETVDAQVTLADGRLHITGTTTIRLSDFGIEPISLAGFVTVGDEARLSFDLVARPASEAVASDYAAPVVATAATPGGTVGQPVSFKSTIQPILAEHCASCHTGDGSGTHAIPLATAADAAAIAPGLSLAVSSRYMPPWPASDLGVPLRDTRSLSAAQIADVTAWAAAGAPLDVDPSTPITAAAGSGGPTIRHDVTMPLPEPYQPTPDEPDDYHCFVLDPHVTEPTTITGFEFVPDQTAVVHHAVITKITAPGRAAVDRADQADPSPGWSCSVGAPLSVNLPADAGAPAPAAAAGPPPRSESVTVWAPGQAPTRYPDGAGVRLEPGDFFSIQVHYHVEHPTPPDRSTFHLQTDRGELDEVVADTYLGPAEIPCTAGTTSPDCDRATVVGQLVEKFGIGSALIPDGLLMMCNQKAEDFAGMTDGTARSSCTHAVVHPGDVVWMMGHEHQIGSSVRLTINKGQADERVLLDIPRWDFNWQLLYQPAEQVTLAADDTVTIDCSWDRSVRAEPHPRYITWAEGSGDEMCYSVIATRQTTPP